MVDEETTEELDEPLEEATDGETPEEESEGAQEEQLEEETVDLDGELIPKSQLKTERMLHKAFTQKTQALAEQARKYQGWERAEEALQANPADAAERLNTLLQQYGVEVKVRGQEATVSEPNWDELSDDTRELLKPLYAENRALKGQIQQVTPVLQNLQQFVASIQAKDELEAKVSEAVHTIRTVHGYAATAEQMKTAVELHPHLKVDPEAAWLKAFGPKAKAATVKATVGAVAKTKPNSVSTKANTIDTSEMDADEIVQAMIDGKIPLPD